MHEDVRGLVPNQTASKWKKILDSKINTKFKFSAIFCAVSRFFSPHPATEETEQTWAGF
jgi:hypothetical protein